MTKQLAAAGLFLLALAAPTTPTLAQSNDAYSQALNDYTSVKTPFPQGVRGQAGFVGL